MKQYLNIIIILITIFLSFNVNGQVSSPTIVKGFVIDSHSEEPLPYATIVFENTNTGTTSNEEGFFILTGIQKSSKIHISSMGYEDTTINIIVGERQTINIKLMPKTILLEEANLSFKRSRYKNKDNPAVELIKKVIENKDNNRKENMDFLSYEKYDKTQFALSNLSERFMNRKSLKKFAFIFENIDTTKLEGALILPIYIKETLSDFYSQKSPEKTKEIIKADKMVSFDGYLNNQGMSQYLNYMYQDIDIYDNTVTFVTNIFLSPIANTATTFYKYFILDTISIAEASYIKVFFSPRNKTDMLFNGYLYITADSNYAIKKLEMSVNENINLNWVKDVSIIQEFEKAQNNSWFLKFDEISIDFGLSENSMGIFGQRSVYYNKFKINEVISDTLLNGAKVIQLEDADNRNSDFWEVNRPVVLSKSEKGIYAITDSIQEIPAFKRTMDVFMLLFAGYKDFGKFEIGPINTFYSYNSIEGPRLRFGGRTTPQFSEKINFETYLAYGLFDNKFKNYLSTTYSFTGNNIYHFPVKSIKLSYQNETQIPGQELQFIQEDN
ncbi:MAG: carboxypeptidase-like regulatory domain-containing protein, partial [Bacteroidetes bacterium]|nr:carboxypeptidase-like regulatory domain-containing protein [Bacteroidota bacterium]